MPSVRSAACSSTRPPFSVPEAGTATITVVRNGSLDGTAIVDYTTSNGTALAGTHYAATSGTLTFGPGEEGRAFTVGPIENTVVNGNRSVNLTLSNATGAALGGQQTAVLTIVNDDNGGTIGFATATGDVAEDRWVGRDPGRPHRHGPGERRHRSVRHRQRHRAGGGRLHRVVGNADVRGRRDWPDLHLPILNNTLLEGNKTFQAKLSNPVGGAPSARGQPRPLRSSRTTRPGRSSSRRPRIRRRRAPRRRSSP